MSECFDTRWLTLREPFDYAARSVALARRLVDRLPVQPRLLDLGAGTGSLFRFLAPIIGRRQDWILVDTDAALLDDAFGRTAAWARRQGFAATSSGDELRISTSRGLWRVQLVCADGAASRVALSGTDAVVCSALLDLVPAAWLRRLCDVLTVPFLACLTVDGRDAWLPHHSSDALVRTAFQRDMRRDKGLGPALGSTAPSATRHELAARGFVIASAPSDWRIPGSALRMQRAVIEGRAAAARSARPLHVRSIAEWEEARLHQAMRDRLVIRIGHRDILALPPGG